MDEIEKSVPHDYCLSSFAKYCNAKRSSGQIFLSHPHTHDNFYLLYDVVSGSEIRPCNKIDFGKRYDVDNNIAYIMTKL